MKNINIEISTQIKTKNKKEIQRLKNVIEAFCIILSNEFPTCEIVNLCIYDNRDTIKKLFSETSEN